MPPRCWGVKGRGRGKIPAVIWCTHDLFKGRFCPIPMGPLALLGHLWIGWTQAGPHASGRDEPGQIGRSSPKSWFRVPWQARPFCASGAEGPDSPSLGLRPRESALACAPSGSPLRRAHWALLCDPLGRTRGKPGPFAPLAQKGRTPHRSDCVLASRHEGRSCAATQPCPISKSAQPIWSPHDKRSTAHTPNTCCAGAGRGSRRGCRGG